MIQRGRAQHFGKFSRISPILLSVVAASCGEVNRNQTLELQSAASSPEGYIVYNGQALKVPYTVKDDKALVGGDMLIPLSDVVGEKDATLGLANYKGIPKWPNGRVPYDASEIKNLYANELAYMVSEWKKAGFRWVEKTSEDKIFVKFKPTFKKSDKDTACGRADVGYYPERNGGESVIRLPAASDLFSMNCDMLHVMLHESGHVLGFLHEHQRTDRDKFVQFLGDITRESWLQKLDGLDGKDQGENISSALDYNSVMMYGTVSTGGKMVHINGSKIKLNCALSATDIESAAKFYGLKIASNVVTTPVPCDKFQLNSQTSNATKCIDIVNDSTKDKLSVVSCGNYTGQKWRGRLEGRTSSNDLMFSLRTDFTGESRCLGVVTSNGRASPNMVNCSSAVDQKWIFLAADVASVRLKNVSLDRCLNLSSSGVLEFSKCASATSQNWILK